MAKAIRVHTEIASPGFIAGPDIELRATKGDLWQNIQGTTWRPRFAFPRSPGLCPLCAKFDGDGLRIMSRGVGPVRISIFKCRRDWIWTQMSVGAGTALSWGTCTQLTCLLPGTCDLHCRLKSRARMRIRNFHFLEVFGDMRGGQASPPRTLDF